MYCEIRKWNTTSTDEVIRRARTGFVPLISKHKGFVAYYILDEAPTVVASISIFQTRQEARESNALAAEWVKENIASLMQGPPEITEGEVQVHVQA